MAKGWHSPTSSRTQQVQSSLDVHSHGHVLSRHTQRVYRHAGRDLEHHARRYTCGFLSEGQGESEKKKTRPAEGGARMGGPSHLANRNAEKVREELQKHLDGGQPPERWN